MGLNMTHGCFDGAYSAFRRFREDVQRAAAEHADYVPDFDAHPFRCFMGWWLEGPDCGYDGPPSTKTHPLDVFFVHSDCDGYIFPRDMPELIVALTKLLPHVESTSEASGYPSHQQRLASFVAGLQSAYDDGEIVGFR